MTMTIKELRDMADSLPGLYRRKPGCLDQLQTTIIPGGDMGAYMRKYNANKYRNRAEVINV